MITPENFAYPVTTEASTKDNSFKVENNEGAQAELTGDGSSATAKVVKSGDDWHIKFYAFTGAELKKGQTYHVTMDVAGADGCGVAFKNPSVEGETGFGSGTITGGKIDQTITPEENGTLEVILKIGTVAAGNEVKVSNFKIEEVKETEGENLMTDPLKVQAPQINSWNHDDYVTSLSNTDSSATMNIEKLCTGLEILSGTMILEKSNDRFSAMIKPSMSSGYSRHGSFIFMGIFFAW